MKKIEELYVPFKTTNEYVGINEKEILEKLLCEEMGALEAIISRIINEAVLEHMSLTIDSTLMQMLFLNDYLISLFMKNFEALIHNYSVNYLRGQGILEIDEEKLQVIDQIAKHSDIKTTLEEIIEQINGIQPMA